MAEDTWEKMALYVNEHAGKLPAQQIADMAKVKVATMKRYCSQRTISLRVDKPKKELPLKAVQVRAPRKVERTGIDVESLWIVRKQA